MNDGKEVRRFHMILSMSSPLQRQAWEWISALPPGERTNAVCFAVCRAFDQRDIKEEIRRTIREAVRKELDGMQPVQVEPAEQDASAESPEIAGNLDDAVNGFLDSLECDG